jgi:hypothetical protein
MKLSIEAIVAATLAVVFAGFIVGAIAQEQSQHATGGPNRYDSTNSHSLSQVSARGSSSSLSQLPGGAREHEVPGLY